MKATLKLPFIKTNATLNSRRMHCQAVALLILASVTAVDAGVVVDKIETDLGGLKPSYDGPAETRLTSTP